MRRGIVLVIGLVGACSADDGPAAAPDQPIWRNGNYGTWVYTNGNTIDVAARRYNGTQLEPVAVADDVSGGTPSLQMTCSLPGTCHFSLELDNATISGAGALDLPRYRDGHLRFDLKMLTPDATAATVNLFSALDVSVPAAALSATTFTAVAIPLTPDLFGTDGPLGDELVGPAFDIDVTVSTAANNLPVLLLNDVRWTAD